MDALDPLITPALANGVGVVTVVVIVGLMVMRGSLVPGTIHREAVAAAKQETRKAEERAARWETVALSALRATEKLADPVAVTARVLTTLPNPAREEGANT